MARRPSTAPGPTRDTGSPSVVPKSTAKSNRGSLNAFWSFGSSLDKRSGAVPGPQTLNSIAQTRANGQLGASPSATSFIQVSLPGDTNRLHSTHTKLLTKSRRSALFRSSGYVSDDNGSGDGHSSHYAKRADILDDQRGHPPTSKTQLQSTPEEAQEVLDLGVKVVPDRARRARDLHFISPPAPIISTHQDNSSTGNLQSPPSRSRSGSRSLSRPPPSPSSYAVYNPPPFIAPSISPSPVAASLSREGVSGLVGKPPRPDRNPARGPHRKSSRRPSTANGALEGSFARDMIQPMAVPYLHPVKSTQAPFKSKKLESSISSEKPQFSTADRTILAELKENLSARNSQFTSKNGKKHHPYSAKEVPFPRDYERIVLDHEMWETLFYQQLTKDVTFHRFDTPPSKALDIGCGSGAWILNASRVWKQTHFVGLDIVPIHPDLTRVGSTDLANRVSWIQSNFLEGLPFPNEEFDFVMVKRIARGVPEDKWDALLEEIVRVMKPGAAIEVVEEDLYFPGSMSDPLILAAGSTGINASSTSNLSTVSSTSHESGSPPPPQTLAQSSPMLVAPFPRTKRLSEPSDQPHKRVERGDVSVGIVQAEKLRSSVSAIELGRSRMRGYSGSGTMILPSMGGVLEGVEVGSGPDRSEGISRDLGTYARNDSGELFNVTMSTMSSKLLEVPERPPQRPKTAQPSSTPRLTGRKRGMSASRVGAPGSGFPPSPPLPFQLQPQSSVQNLANEQTPSNVSIDGLPASPPEQSAPEPRGISLFRTPTKNRKSEKEDGNSSREVLLQPEIPRLLYKPSTKTPFNPRDHSILERIYRETHEARFINLTPLALLAAQLGLYFKHVKTHAPISFAFPPKPKKKYVLGEKKPLGVYPWSDDEDDHDDPLFPHIGEYGTTSPERPDLTRRTSKRTLDRNEESAPQYVVVDNARLPASAPRNAKSRIYSESVHSNNSSETISPTRSTKSFRAFAVSVSPDRSQPDVLSLINAQRQTKTQVNVPSVPGRALEIDLRSLHMHLSTRVSETLACAEAMWEWVMAEQQRHAAERTNGRGRSRSMGDDEDVEVDAQMKAIRELTRADFDACLSRFEMDMHDNIALDHALDQHLCWKPVLPHTRTAERKSFETACAIWDTRQAALAADADGDSERSGASCVDQSQTRFSRTFRIFAAWKEDA